MKKLPAHMIEELKQKVPNTHAIIGKACNVMIIRKMIHISNFIFQKTSSQKV